jgi:hypothetical protein
MLELLLKLKNFVKTLKRNSRKNAHEAYLWGAIRLLRIELIDDVLRGSIQGRMPVKELKRKAELIRKYSRRLKLIKT